LLIIERSNSVFRMLYRFGLRRGKANERIRQRRDYPNSGRIEVAQRMVGHSKREDHRAQ
jgi:hypothetical protein